MRKLFYKMFQIIKTHPILKIVRGALMDLPSPANLSSWWNFGSLVGLCLGVQLLSGVFLAMHFTADTGLSFTAVSHHSQEILQGALIRTLHANRARFFFFCLYFHVGRGVYYRSYKFHTTWGVGVVILLLVMASAFLGYVLPWGQMSFWGTTVITRLLSVIPFIGEDVVIWLWGGYRVCNSTLVRFFAFHFLTPFIVAALALIHLLFLHQTGSGNPLGVNSNYDKIPFQPYFTFKDLFGAYAIITLIVGLILINPWLLGDPENFIISNPIVTPVHIQPEWYFLFAYAILRSIPRKLGGVIALALSILILLSLRFTTIIKFRGSGFYPIRKIYFWTLVGRVLLLTWIGARPVEAPYILTGQVLTVFYFRFYALYPVAFPWWESTLK